MEEREKLCLWCKHFWLSMGSEGYSEWTPGYPGSISCTKGKWEMDEGDAEDMFRLCLLTAGGCPLYELADSIEALRGG